MFLWIMLQFKDGYSNSRHKLKRPFGKEVYECIHEHVKDAEYPVCFGFPVSHSKENYALKIGVEYTLDVSMDKTSLKE